jgi:RIO kinase 1
LPDDIFSGFYYKINRMQTDLQPIIDKAKQLDHTITLISDIRSGKEAVVYKVLLDNEPAAMKVYKDPERRSFKNTTMYLSGKHYKKASEQRAMDAGNKFSKKLKFANWIAREFFLLEKLYALGASIPKPLLQVDNAILMELLGNDSETAPRLCDIDFTPEAAEEAFESIIKSVLIFWEFGIVHSDLSAYNILWWNDKPYIIDFPQAVDKRLNREADELLERDLLNITEFFRKYIAVEYDEVRKRFKNNED